MRNRKVVILEPLRRHAARVIVELVDEQHIGPDVLDDLGNDVWLSAAGRRQFRGEITCVEAVQRGVEGGEANRGLLLLAVSGLGRNCTNNNDRRGNRQQSNYPAHLNELVSFHSQISCFFLVGDTT